MEPSVKGYPNKRISKGYNKPCKAQKSTEKAE